MTWTPIYGVDAVTRGLAALAAVAAAVMLRRLLPAADEAVPREQLAVSSSGKQITREPFDVGVVIDGVIDELRPSAEEKGLALRRGPGEPAELRSDRRLLKVALLHLVGNAIKFTSTGFVEVTAARAGRALTITVRDSGPGIPAEARARIFEPFEQLTPPGLEAAPGGRDGAGAGGGQGHPEPLERPHPAGVGDRQGERVRHHFSRGGVTEVGIAEYGDLDGLALADLVRRRQVTAAELMEEAIARAERVNGRINAIIAPLYEDARRAAATLPVADQPDQDRSWGCRSCSRTWTPRSRTCR